MSIDPTPAPLIALIHEFADGDISVEQFVETFKETHESLERQGHVRYANRDQARLIWDVLWALEFFDEAASEHSPRYVHNAETVVREVNRVSVHLRELGM